MRFAYLAFFENPAGANLSLSAADRAAVTEIIRTTPALTRGLIYSAENAEDMYTHDGASPPFGLQLYFDELSDLEAALGPAGHLQQLAVPGFLPSLEGADVTQQAMYVRPFPVDDPALRTGPGDRPCSYVIHYTGPAEDMNVWLSHYVGHHPQVMRTFPGIRAIEVLSRVDWCGFLPWRRVDHMQRNRVMFDSPAALQAALHSPARIEMRKNFHLFPPFAGDNFHYPMATDIISPMPAGKGVLQA